MTQQATTPQAPERAQWTGQIGFILSAIGSAVGLGNIWRFPGVAYENGGGAFLIPYIVALLTAGIPILFLDYAIGHRFRGSAPLAFRRLAGKLGEGVGWFQVMICILIAVYYTAVLAWALSFFVFSFDLGWGDDPGAFFFADYLNFNEKQPLTFDFVPGVLIPLVIMWVVALVVLGLGVVRGVQWANMIAIPLLVVGFLILVVRSLFLPGAMDGLNTLFTPDFARLTDPTVWVAAYGQVFFSLSIAFGIMITYSSYRRRKSNLTAPGLVVAFGNSSFEILAGIGVFSTLGFLAATQGVQIGDLGFQGVGLAFVTFPAIVSEMPGGPLFGALFFGSLVLAGLTSLISIMEVILAAFIDKFGLTRIQAVGFIGGILALVSVIFFGTTSGLTALDTIDNWANNVGIVASAVATCYVVLWVRGGPMLKDHLSSLSTFKVGGTWIFFISVLGPIMLGYMLIQKVVDLINEPYGGYDPTYLGFAGWGSVVFMIVGSLIFTNLRWKRDPYGFRPWPALQTEQESATPVKSEGGAA